jgi:translation initiation factor 4E
MPPAKLALPKKFCFWFKFYDNTAGQTQDYEQNLKKIGSFDTAEDFWGYYKHINRPNSLPFGYEIILFDDQIKPTWEDEANKNGGSIRILTQKYQSNQFWENIILELIGEVSNVTEKISGIRTCSKKDGIMIDIWIKASTEDDIALVENWVKKAMEIPSGQTVKFFYRHHPKK